MAKQSRFAFSLFLVIALGTVDGAWGQGFGGRGGRRGGGGGGERSGGGQRYSGGGERYGGGGERYGGGGDRYSGGGERYGEGGGRYGGSTQANRPSSNFNYNSHPNSQQMNKFMGLPSDAGMNSVAKAHPQGNNYDVNTSSYTGPRGGEAEAASVTGPRGDTYGGAAAVGPHGGEAAVGGVKGPGGHTAGAGGAVGPEGRTYAGSATGNVAQGTHGAGAGFGYTSPSGQYSNASAMRNNFNGYGAYHGDWYGSHPGAWTAAGLGAGAAWSGATWSGLDNWLGYGGDPVSYDYGSNVSYDSGNVYMDGQNVGTADQYYSQAQSLASNGGQSPPDDSPWMPLGVFAASKSGETKVRGTIELAVNKTGTIRGNYTDSATDQVQVVKGSYDKKSLRAAWTFGDSASPLVETGLYNLTKDQTNALVHYGKDRTEQWLLVRLNRQDKSGQ